MLVESTMLQMWQIWLHYKVFPERKKIQASLGEVKDERLAF